MNNFACRLVGLGLWLAQRRREPLPNLLPLGRWAVATLNEAYQQAEIARRHAKPSTRKRWV